MLREDARDTLIVALAEVERYVTKAGWDQAARLFALVTAQRLMDAEPSLAGQLTGVSPQALTAIEQDHFHGGDDLPEALAGIGWPDQVEGCAMAVERSFLPAEFEGSIPDDPGAAARFVANHPHRQDVRVVVGALRTGRTHALARLASNPDELLGAEDLVPGLSAALLGTFDDDKERNNVGCHDRP